MMRFIQIRSFLLPIFLFVLSCVQAQPLGELSQKGAEAQTFCKKNNLNTDFCFLIDLSIHSGKNRFYVYDLSTKKVIASGLVCHGIGKNSTYAKPVYSNEIGSNCTSIGKYKLGKRAWSNWGINIHYKMHGLEKSNSNAAIRNVVLHSYDQVSEKEIYPNYLPLGWSLGCPVIANDLMKKIDSLLKKTKKPTLLWIYE